jgi:cation diffusion facilitator family transporter
VSVNQPTQPGHDGPDDHGHDHPHPHPHDAPTAAADDHGHDHPHPHPHDEAAAGDHGDHGHDHPHPHPHDEAAAGDHGDHGHGDHGHDHGDHGHDHGDHAHRGGIIGFVQSLFMPHSHDVADQIDTALETSAKGIRATKISLVIMAATAIIQLSLVYVTNSVALLADTVHNFGDALTSIPLWMAFIIGRRAATRRFTFGFRRAEDLAGLFIVVMIGLSAIWVFFESLERLINPVAIDYLPVVIGAGIVGFLGNEAIALYRIRVGREIQSAALVADGYHARTDGFTSLGVVVGGIGVALGFPQADPIMGLIIAGMIVLVLVGAIKQVFSRLMDAVDPTIVDEIERVAATAEGVRAIDGVRVRWVGHRLETSLHAEVECQMSVADGHEIAENVRHVLFHEVRNLDAVMVHIDPCEHPETDHHVNTRSHEPEHLSRSTPAGAAAAAAGER